MLLSICLLLVTANIEDDLKALQTAAEADLLKALKHSDWEIVHRAVDQLGERGTDAAVDELVDLAVQGPVRRIRLAAAEALRKRAPAKAAEAIARRMKGDFVFRAAEALAVLGQTGGTKLLDRMLTHKDPDRRRAAVRAFGGQRDASRERFATWTKMLGDESILVRAAVVDALVKTGSKSAIGPLRDRLKRPNVSQVMERRYIESIYRLLRGLEGDDHKFAVELTVQMFGMGGGPEQDARFARLLGSLGRKDASAGPVDQYTDRLVRTGLSNQAPEVRRASAAALARIGAEEAFEKLDDMARTDTDQRVRFHAMRAALALGGEKALPLLLDRTRHDDAIKVREEAATLCAKLRKVEAAATLVSALKDPAWEVRTCAAVSLGRLHAEAGVAPLIEMCKEKDWRLRGAAVCGLGRIRSKQAVPVLIDALTDKETAVAASALEYLRHISGKKLAGKQKPWREWWATHGAQFAFVDKDKAAREAKKYGYAVTRRAVYEDMDIVVLSTRGGGDNIQYLLKDYGIEHRIVRAASVHKTGLHPYALFVANCPGEITNKDVERLQWFVRAGGYLFGSCWALTHTIHKAFPDVVDKFPLPGQVIGVVGAEPRPSPSPFLEGVFDRATSPLYTLEGSHLIRVLDPERFEVLIDSPEAASIWGDGNLAGWFSVGHGTILDSANHFDLQGMAKAKVKTEKDRMAFALDHLGYDYAELRKLREEGVFRKQALAVEKTRDVSIFRFITTFVRQKRLADEQ